MRYKCDNEIITGFTKLAHAVAEILEFDDDVGLGFETKVMYV